MKAVMFMVPGEPQGKARARTFYHPEANKHVSMTPERTVLYENLIKECYMLEAGNMYLEAGVPVKLCIVAQFLPPKRVSKKKRLDMLEGRILPLKKPDTDNIVKVVSDALNGVAYHDDTQIASIWAEKIYSEVEGLNVTVEEYTKG